MKKILTLMLVLSLLLSLGACSLFGLGSTTAPATTDNASTNEPTTPKETPNTKKLYTVTVTDEEGNGINGISVMISSEKDESVAGGPTDENGVFSEELLKNDTYTVSLMAVPNKYEVAESYTFTEFACNIVLKAKD